MTALATNGLVCILELIIRKGVIKCFPVELIDVGATPLMVGVTVPAFLFHRIGL